MINYDFLTYLRMLKQQIIDHNGLIENDANIYRKTFSYKFPNGVSDNLKSLKREFRKDIEFWMSEWDEPILDKTVFHARIKICYYTRNGEYKEVTDNFKFYSDYLYPSENYLSRWQTAFAMFLFSNRRVSLSRIRELHFDLEFYNYSKDSELFGEIIPHGKSNIKNIDIKNNDESK